MLCEDLGAMEGGLLCVCVLSKVYVHITVLAAPFSLVLRVVRSYRY